MSDWSDVFAAVLEEAGFTEVAVVSAPLPPHIVRLLAEECDECDECDEDEAIPVNPAEALPYFMASTAQGNIGFLVAGAGIPAVDLKTTGVKIEEFRFHSADAPPPEWSLIFYTEGVLRQLRLLMERKQREKGEGKK